MKTVITGRSSLFPGSQDTESFWRRILESAPAELASFEKIWNLRRETYFSEDPSASDRIYQDRAYCLPAPFGKPQDEFHFADEGRQITLGKFVLDNLLQEATRGRRALDLARTALVLGTSWSDGHYFAADARMVAFGQSKEEAMKDKRLDPAGQLRLLAEHLGIHGPRFSVDTACASSLYALAGAERLLSSGLADHVIVLGLNAHLPSFLFAGFSKIQAMSRQGAIRPFSSEADGILLGEGVGAVLLERSDLALEAGRKPLAVVRSIGLSADGREGSVFSPGREGQKLAIKRAYQNARPDEIDYIEAHGTGTPLGDAAEIEAFQDFFGSGGAKNLPIGSVKSLIGHTLAASGMASLIKGIEMLRTRTLPPHISVQAHPRLQNSCLRLLDKPVVLDRLGRPMRIGINSLGFGGANAHVVIEEWTEATAETSAPAKSAERRYAIIAMEALIASEKRSFPEREGHPDHNYGEGHFLRGDAIIDRRILRLGPAQVKRLDPFLTVLAQQIGLSFAATDASADRSGLLICSNFGAESSLKLARKFQAIFHGQRPHFDQALSMEAVTSSLPALTSGLPAAANNLRGFHQTFSGSEDSFWQALLMTDSWMQGGLDTLILGASSFIKSPYDFVCRNRPDVAEGSAVFAIVREEDAKGRALAWMDFGEFKGETAQIINCQASPLGLGEASGIEVLDAILRGGESSQLLEIHRGSSPMGRLRITRTARALEAAKAIPTEFAVPISLGKDRETATAAPDIAVSTTRADTGIGGWNRDMADLMKQFLESRARVSTALFTQNKTVRQDLSPVTRRAKNVTIADTRIERSRAQAKLVVDESHPYFFDHPLDHVPGILILEAIMQLAEAFLQANPQISAGQFIAKANISFRRYIEKHLPVTLNLTYSERQILVVCNQEEQLCCSVDLELLQIPAKIPSLPSAMPGTGFPDKKILHKVREENILVSSVQRVLESAEERYRTQALPLSEDHFFHDGEQGFHSLVYLLEIARQTMMQLAHTVMGIPLGTPMNLIGLKIELNSPISRQGVLQMEAAKSRVLEADNNLLARIVTSFLAEGNRLGSTEITAQVMKKEYYEKQRKKAGT